MRIPPALEREVCGYAAWKLSLTPSTVLDEIRDNKAVFMYLVGERHDATNAYEELHRMLQRGEDPKRLFAPATRLHPLETLRPFYGIDHGPLPEPPREPLALPAWFEAELWRQISPRFPPSDLGENMAFWLTARLFLDRRFMSTVALARKRWHIRRPAAEWYEQMAAFQANAIEFCANNGVRIVALPGGRYRAEPVSGQLRETDSAWSTYGLASGGTPIVHDDGYTGYQLGGLYGGAVRFTTPKDFRDTETYGRSFSTQLFGLPFFDFDGDLAALAWLAGGDSEHHLWRHWMERILWDFQEVPLVDLPRTWRETGRNSVLVSLPTRLPANTTRFPDRWPPPRRTTHLPPFVEVTSDSGVNLRLLSRWVRLGDYPDEAQATIIYGIVRRWGDYEEPPDKANLKRALLALLRPASQTAAEQEIERSLPEDADLSELGAADKRAKTSARQRRSRRVKRRLTPPPRPF